VRVALNEVEPLTSRQSADTFGESPRGSQKPQCEVIGRHDNEAECENDVHDPRQWLRIDLGINPR
jgi:hypothetical protein